MSAIQPELENPSGTDFFNNYDIEKGNIDSNISCTINGTDNTDAEIFEEQEIYEIHSATKKKEPFAHFGKFIVAALIYAAVFTFCRYKVNSGILIPAEYLSTAAILLYGVKVLGYKIKPGFIFALASYVLLGFNMCTTEVSTLIIFDQIGGILILFAGLVHECYNDKNWGFGKYFVALHAFFWYTVIYVADPFIDYSRIKNKSTKSKTGLYILIGALMVIPVALIVLSLLWSADMMFKKALDDFFVKINFRDCLKIACLFLTVCLAAYAFLKRMSKKNINEEVHEIKGVNSVIGITFNSVLTFIYLVFSVFQFVFLFFRSGLPEGYTYASYAHTGFYQLVAVSILNLLIVFISKVVFSKSKILDVILLLTSLCTFIMIASSFYRMILYIDVYRLTELRVLTLWALTVITLIMAVICAYIVKPEIPVAKTITVIVTVMYLILAYSHPTRIIADYNMKEFLRTGEGDLYYVSRLCEASDAFMYAESVVDTSNTGNLQGEALHEYIDARDRYFRGIRFYGEFYNKDNHENSFERFRNYNFACAKEGRAYNDYVAKNGEPYDL